MKNVLKSAHVRKLSCSVLPQICDREKFTTVQK